MLPNPGLYVHFPWCIKKCPYCDFNSHPLRDDSDKTKYTHCLIDDLHSQSSGAAFASVFLGGGTPSLFSAEHISQVLAQIDLERAAEVTMETNPGTTEYTDFELYRDAGVNRISLGAQSFATDHLKALGRIHGAGDISVAYEKARHGGIDNINIDLMWGLPEQTLTEALSDLKQAIALQPDHISWYQLTLEPKTEFARRPPTLPDEDTLYAIEAAGIELLAKHSYQRYEVSAYAQPTKSCVHNTNYWTFGDYLGIGAGAHGKQTETSNAWQAVRTRKSSQPRLYQQNPNFIEIEPVVDDQLAFEYMLNALRLVEGTDWETFEAHTGLDRQAIQEVWTPLVEQELVREERCATTPLGLRYLDTVVSKFLSD